MYVHIMYVCTYIYIYIYTHMCACIMCIHITIHAYNHVSSFGCVRCTRDERQRSRSQAPSVAHLAAEINIRDLVRRARVIINIIIVIIIIISITNNHNNTNM